MSNNAGLVLRQLRTIKQTRRWVVQQPPLQANQRRTESRAFCEKISYGHINLRTVPIRFTSSTNFERTKLCLPVSIQTFWIPSWRYQQRGCTNSLWVKSDAVFTKCQNIGPSNNDPHLNASTLVSMVSERSFKSNNSILPERSFLFPRQLNSTFPKDIGEPVSNKMHKSSSRFQNKCC